MKKAQMSAPFNYILIMVVGVIILIFFIGFAFKQIRLSDYKTSSGLVRTIDNSLNTLMVTQNTYTLIPQNGFPSKIEFKLQCNKLTVGTGIPKEINKIIFSPSIINGKQIQAWSLAWKFPYRIDNLYYLSNKNHRYILIYDSFSKDFVDNLYEDLPTDLFNIQKIDENNLNIDNLKIESRSLDTISFIFFTQKPTRINEIKDKISKAKIISITPEEKGEIIFYEDNYKKFQFYSKPLMFGAIFSQDSDSYKCSLENSNKKLEFISNLYAQKATYLNSLEKPNCIYNGIKSNLIKFPQLTKEQEIFETISFLNSQNSQLIGDGCAPVY